MKKWALVLLGFGGLNLASASDASAQNVWREMEGGLRYICEQRVMRGYNSNMEECRAAVSSDMADDMQQFGNWLWKSLHLAEVLQLSEQLLCTKIAQGRPPGSWIAGGACYYLASKAAGGPGDDYGAVAELDKYFNMADPSVVSQLQEALEKVNEEKRNLLREAILRDLRRAVPQMQQTEGGTLNAILSGWVPIVNAVVTVQEQYKLPKPNNNYEVGYTLYIDDGTGFYVEPINFRCEVDDLDNIVYCDI